MSWITVVWSVVAGICLAMAGVHLLVWLINRGALTNLAFALSAVGAAATAVFELALMHSQTMAQYGQILRWMHIPIFVLVVSFIWFVGLYLQTGRAWLLWSFLAVRALVVIVNMVSEPNVSFQEITSLHFVSVWGDTFAVAEGIMSPWRYLIRFGDVLLLLFIADASHAAWKQGRIRRALMAGAVFFVAVSIGLTSSVMLGNATLLFPFTLSMPFLLVTLVMGIDMSFDLLRSQKTSLELSESQKRIQLAAQAVKLGIWEWDVGKDEVWVTEAGRAGIGAGEKEKLGFDRFLQSVHPDDRETVRTYVQHAVEEAGEVEIEYRMISPDGAVQWISNRGHVERDVSGKAVRVRGVTVDITDSKNEASERIQLRLELAHLSRVLTMNELSSSLAHEINQPLGAILNNASTARMLLARSEGDGEVGEIMDDIIADTTRAGQIVRKIRGIIRKGSVQFEPLDINILIGEVVELFRNPLNRERIIVREELSPDLLPVRGDRIRLQQVVMNLLMNATDAMKGSANRVLTIRSAMQRPDRANVSISDTGPGIDEKMKNRLFSPFATTKKNGLGMGLRICKSILEDHGGSIRAENNPEGGATFSFTLKADSGGTA